MQYNKKCLASYSHFESRWEHVGDKPKKINRDKKRDKIELSFFYQSFFLFHIHIIKVEAYAMLLKIFYTKKAGKVHINVLQWFFLCLLGSIISSLAFVHSWHMPVVTTWFPHPIWNLGIIIQFFYDDLQVLQYPFFL